MRAADPGVSPRRESWRAGWVRPNDGGEKGWGLVGRGWRLLVTVISGR